MRKEIISKSPEETKKMGEELGRVLKGGECIALSGPLGAGKTTLVQGIAKGLGVGEEEYVRSPSFVFLHIYQGRLFLYHFDLYRLNSLPEVYTLGWEEYLSDKRGVVVVEWGEKVERIFPFHLLIRIDYITPTWDRKICIEGDESQFFTFFNS